jgi:hypothetical protein
MATPAQLRANQANSQKSTGPSSVEGKSAVRFNALKHGMDAQSVTIPGEDPAELEQLSVSYHQRFQPHSPEESHLVETLIQSDWLQRRYARVEAQLFHVLLAEHPDSPTPLGAVFHQDAQSNGPLQKIFRRQEAASRAYFRALRELRLLQQVDQDLDFDLPLPEPAAPCERESAGSKPIPPVCGQSDPTPAAVAKPAPPPHPLENAPLAWRL